MPIDWTGSFGVDMQKIDTYAKKNVDSGVINDGSYEVPIQSGSKGNATFESYVFRLGPTIIVNDSASLIGELTNGYSRGGVVGSNTTRKLEGGFGNALYNHNFSDSGNNIFFSKLYMELYSDTAIYQIGRHSYHWGLGVLFDDGNDLWDRYLSLRDGVTMKIKLGNFDIAPYWGKIGSNNSYSEASRMKEYGVAVSYDNAERDIGFGVLYGKKKNNPNNKLVTTDIEIDGTDLGNVDIDIIDIYFKKVFGKFEFGLEAPIVISGEMSSLAADVSNTSYKARAVIFESHYNFTDIWRFSFFAGSVSGDDGSKSSYDAMYLHPNYQIANLMFRYNMLAVGDAGAAQSIYDAYISNTQYLKLAADYTSGKWNWKAAFIYAMAAESAVSGQSAYNHQTNRWFTATADQSDDLGFEVDIDFDYKWNNKVQFGGSFGYHFVGDYYGFTNSETTFSVENTYIAQIRVGLSF